MGVKLRQISLLIILLLFYSLLLNAIPLRIDLEKKTEGLISLSAKLEIEKKAQCFQVDKEMQCYAIMRSVDIPYWEGEPTITATTPPQKIEYLLEVYRFNKTYNVGVCLKYEEGECVEWGEQKITEQWAEFEQTPSAILTKNEYSAIKIVFPKWSFSLLKGNFTIQAGQISADPEISTCGSTLTSGSHWLTTDLNCTDNGLIFGDNDIELDCAGHTIEYARISNGHGVSATGRKNVTIKNCNFIQQNASINSNGNGVYFVNDVQNSRIENCSFKLIGKTEGAGIQVGSYASPPTYNITINNITILTTPNTAKGIIVYAKGWTNITNFFINTTGSAEAYPLYIASGSQYTNIINGSVYSAYSYGIYYERNDGGYSSVGQNYVKNVSITTTNAHPLVIREVNSSVFENMTITGTYINRAGVFLYLGSSFLQFKNININMTQASSLLVGFDRSYSNHLFENLNFLSTNNNYQINGSTQYGYVGGNITFRNLTDFNRNKVGFVGADIRNNFTLQWYVRVNVSWVNGTPIEGAIVNATNEQGIFQDFGTTGADGLTDWVVMNDTMFRGAVSNISYALTNFSANASNAILNTTNVTINNQTTITIFLSPSYVPPPKYLTSYHISPDDGWTNSSNQSLIGVVLTCGAVSNESITSIGIKVWDTTNSLIYQNLTLGEQNEASYPLMLPNNTYIWQCNATTTTLFNESGNRSFTMEYIPPPKTLLVWQSHPPNASIRSSPTAFNCSVNATFETPTTIGIKIWNETNLVFENTTNDIDTSNSSLFLISLSNGDFLWECNASGETLTNTSLYNFSVYIMEDTQPPFSILQFPETMITIRSKTYPFSCFFTDNMEVDYGYFVIWDVNGTMVINQTSSIKKAEELNISTLNLNGLIGSYEWSCGSCDLVGNCQENTTKRYVYIMPSTLFKTKQPPNYPFFGFIYAIIPLLLLIIILVLFYAKTKTKEKT